ncbi:unnamed protein product [Discula destructiva]
MGDRYRYASGRRSPPIYGPGRTSAPNVTTYYGGDIQTATTARYPSTTQVQPTSTSHNHHHTRRSSNSNQFGDWRGPPVSVPVTTTTYTVRKDPVTRSASVREHSRNRAATLETKRPPIIVTTRQAKQPSSTQDASASYVPRRGATSPAPDRGRDYRPSNEYYTQPASSVRSRSHTRPYTSGTVSSTLDNEEFHRLRQRTTDGRPWPEPRRERPSSFYAAVPRHSVPSDMGDSGYEYTKPSDLVRYDLDNDRRSSRDTYYRPTVTLNDVERRPYERTAKGPPPTTRGLDKVNRRVVDDPTAGIYDRPAVRMPVPMVVPSSVADRRSTQLDVPASPIIERRPSRNGHRPVSLYQEGPSRASRDRDYYREESLGRRESIRHEGQKRKDPLVEDLGRDRERRRDSRVDDRVGREPRRHSDEDELERRTRRHSRDHGRKEESPIRPERRIPKDNSARKEETSRDDDHDKEKFRDKVVAGLGLAAGAVGLGGVLNHKDKEDKEDKGSPKRRGEDNARRDETEDRPKAARRDPEERRRDNMDTFEPVKKTKKDRDLEDLEDTERNRRDAEARLNGDASAMDHNSSSDEAKPRRRRRPSSAAFKPNDTASLLALKEQLKAQEGSDKENEKVASKDPSPERRSQPSPPREDDLKDDPRSSKEDLRGREPMMTDDKQVRVVSPPRDKDDKKPIKGILKQPRPQFPEEPNPVREGVAPHKDDKTKGSVPPGARWTKISRKLVNPDALTIGKERFEVRDDFVIVLRVLSKEEIEAYTAATAQLRDMRRKEYEERERDTDDYDDDAEDDTSRRRPHRSHRRDPRDEEEDERRRRDRDRDRGEKQPRSRRYQQNEEEEEEEEVREPARLEYHVDDRDVLPHRRHREREREREPVLARND